MQPTCGQMGGRHRKGHKGKTAKSRKMRGGVFVGFGNNPISAGNAEWVPAAGSAPYSSATGAAIADPYAGGDSAAVLRGGKRRTRKGGKSKKSKKSKKASRRSRKMRGGMYGANGVVNSAGAGAGFTGAIPGFPHGGGTYGNVVGYPVNVPGGNPHQVGADGVTRV